MPSEIQVRLYRDSFSTPWGFRLQGGKDFKAPLTIQRVFVGSPAENELHRGDCITSIENFDASEMTHKEAQDVIKNCGGSCILRILRGAAPPPMKSSQPSFSNTFRNPSGYNTVQKVMYNPPPPQSTINQQPPSFGVDYGKHGRPSAGYQIQDDQDDYQHKPVSDLKRMFSGHPKTSSSSSYHQPQNRARNSRASSVPPGQYSCRPWRKPEASHMASIPSGLKEPGWTPGQTPKSPSNQHHHHHQQQQQWSSVRPAPVNQNYFTNNLGDNQYDDRPHVPPPWAGSLKQSGTLKPWEMQKSSEISGEQPPAHLASSGAYKSPSNIDSNNVNNYSPVQVHTPRLQNVHYGVDGSQQYQQVSDQNAPTAQVKHLQYNTPIGLYSKENVQDVLTNQTSGRPGQGTLQIAGGSNKPTSDIRQSETYKLIHGETGNQRSNQFGNSYAHHSPRSRSYGNPATAAGASDF